MNNNSEGGVDNSSANEGAGLFSRLGSMLFSYRSPKPSAEETDESVTDNSNAIQEQSEVSTANNNWVGSSQDLKPNQSDNNLNGANSNTISTPMPSNKVNKNTPLFTPPQGVDIDISVSRAPASPLFSPPLVVQADLSDSNNTCSPNVLNVGFADESFSSVKEADQTQVFGNDVSEANSFKEKIDDLNTTLVDNDEEKHCQVDTNVTTINKEEKFFDSQPPVEDEIAVPQKSYKLDFDQFDDPDFNPFQTKTAIRNSPELQEDIHQPQVSKSPLPTTSHVSSGIEVDSAGGEELNGSMMQSTDDDLLNNGFNTSDFVDETLADELTGEITETVTVETSIWTNEEVSSMQEDSEVVEINNQPSVEQGDDEIIVPNKSYSFDFDQFDDPNFNPFQTKTAVRNSPEPKTFEVSAPSPPPPTNELTPADDDLPVTNPKEEVDAVISKATAILEVGDSTSKLEVDDAYNCSSHVVEKVGESESQSQTQNEADVEIPAKKVQQPAEIYDEDEEVVPKKSYNFDFDQFDDPNFNPFETKTAVRNSPEPHNTSVDAEQPVKNEAIFVDDVKLEEKAQESSEGKMESDSVQKEMSAEAGENSLTEPIHGDIFKEDEQQMNVKIHQAVDGETFMLASASDKLEVDRFDDPNFNPFETKTAVRNSPEPQDTSIQTEQPVKNEAFFIDDVKLEEKQTQQHFEEQVESNETAAPKTSSNLEMGESETEKHCHNEAGVEAPKTEQAPQENDEIIVPKKSYNFDFDKFDDPNFNPFQTKTAVRNSPEPGDNICYEPGDNVCHEPQVFESPLPTPPLTSSGIEESVNVEAANQSSADDSFKSVIEDDNLLNNGFNASDVTFTAAEETPVLLTQEETSIETTSINVVSSLQEDSGVVSNNQSAATQDEDEIIVPKKSYNFDFDKFDDPNYNPFQTKTAVRNSPELAVTSGQPETITSPPDITEKPQVNEVKSAPKPEETFEVAVESFKEVKKPQPKKRVPMKKKAPVKKKKPEVEMPEPEAPDEDEIIVPKKSYNFDFDKFDDPNYNPFQTKTAVRNSPELAVTSAQPTFTSGADESGSKQDLEIENKIEVSRDEQISTSPPNDGITKEIIADEDKQLPVTKKKNPIRKKAAVAKKPKTPEPEGPDEDEIIVPKKSYNFDFDKFDDPNYNPFQTKTAVRNSPELASGQQETITSPPDITTKPQVNEVKSDPKPKETFEVAVESVKEVKKALPKKRVPIKKKAPVKKRKDFDFRVPMPEPKPEAPDEDEIIVPKKSYNFDFDKFDDPNYNPFQTKTAVRNSPELASGQSETMTSPPEAGDCCVNPPTIVSDLKEGADHVESPTNQNSPSSASAEAKPKSKLKSRLGGLRRPIAKRPPPVTLNIDEEDFDPFVSRNAMQNSPPPANAGGFDDVGAGGDAASAHGNEPYSDDFGGNYESVDGPVDFHESSADASTSTELEQLKNLKQGNVSGRLSESEEMSVDSLVNSSLDLVKAEVMRGGGGLPPTTCRSDDQVNTMSAFRPFNVVRDEVQDKSLVARYELLMERKLRLNMALKNTRKHKRQCELASENLEELIKNKTHQITQVTAEYRGKLDDFYHVRAQIHGFTCREGDIQKSISRIVEENKRLSESLEKRKRGYMASYMRLTNQLSNDHELIKGLREEQDCRTAELRDEFSLLEAKLKKSQIQVSSLESNLQSKSQQCEEMGKLCDELFSSVELNNSST